MLKIRNGKVQLIVTTPGKPKKQHGVNEDARELGRVRKAIEDRKIEKQLMKGDLW